jgi:bile acid:Na+ symporter, BASS family
MQDWPSAGGGGNSPLAPRPSPLPLQRFNDLFALWVVAASALAYLEPVGFAWFQPYIVPGLGVIMLGMGVTLVPADFRRVVERWPAVLLGVACQYGLMPLGGFLVARLLRLPEPLALGVMLVTACPGGTASNVIAYLAHADVALSVSMTTASTLLAPLMTPLMLEVYAGASVQVAFLDQGVAIAQIVVVPVVAGLLLRTALDRLGRRTAVDGVLRIFPSISIAFIVMIVACIVALNSGHLGEFGIAVLAAVMLTNALGLAGGYAVTRLARFDRVTARTIAIEVGLQNSGLGVALANTFFAPATALPSAFYSLWHNVTGPALASYWRRGLGAGDQGLGGRTGEPHHHSFSRDSR